MSASNDSLDGVRNMFGAADLGMWKALKHFFVAIWCCLVWAWEMHCWLAERPWLYRKSFFCNQCDSRQCTAYTLEGARCRNTKPAREVGPEWRCHVHAAILSGTERALTRLSALHGADKLADLTITCRHRSWRVSRAFLALQSDVLLRKIEVRHSLTTRLKPEGLWLDLSEYEPEVVRKFLRYVYLGNYRHNGRGNCSVELAKSDVHMCIFARDHDIPPLQSYAAEKVQATVVLWSSDFICGHANSVADLTALACLANFLSEEFMEVIIDKIVASGVLAMQHGVPRNIFSTMADFPELAAAVVRRAISLGACGTGKNTATAVQDGCQYCGNASEEDEL